MTTSSGATGRDATTRLTVAMLWLLIGVFVLYPLCRLLAMTFWGENGFTFENLKPFVSSWYDQQAAVNSILLGFSVGLAGTILGFIFAFAVTRLQMPSWAKFIISAITILPLISPPFTSSIALTLLLGPNGMILTLLGIEDFNFYGFWGTFISETLTFFPVAFMTLSTILSRIDPNLEDAAYSLGASSLTVFRTVTMPLAVPGIANAFLLVFSCSLADFATPQVLGGHSFPVLPTQAYLQITGMYDFKGGAALSFMLLIPALIVYLLQHYWVSRKNFVTVSGKAGGRSSIHGPGLLVTTVMSVVIASVIALIIAIYSVIVLGSVVKVWGVDNSITFANYEYVMTHGIKAIKDTLLIACIGTPLGGLLAVLVGYVTTRLKVRGHKTLETASLLNYTLPGTVVGIAYIIAFNDYRSHRYDLHSDCGLCLPLLFGRYPQCHCRALPNRSVDRRSQPQPGSFVREDFHVHHDSACTTGNFVGHEVPLHPLHDSHQRNDLPRIGSLDSDHNPHLGMHDRTAVCSGLRLLGRSDSSRFHGLRRYGAAGPRTVPQRRHHWSTLNVRFSQS